MEQVGISAGWISPMLPRLQGENSTIPTTSDEGSWLATAPSLSSIFCAPLITLCLNHLGRKTFTLIGIIPYLISLIIISMATTVPVLLVGRTIHGIGSAFVIMITPIYLGEIAPDEFRGTIGLCMTVFQNIGILRIYLIGMYLDLWLTSFISGLPLLLIIIMYRWLPESPYFLIMKHRTADSVKSLQKLRNREDVEIEKHKIETAFLENSDSNSFKEFAMEPCHRRGLFIALGLITFAQATGGYSFVFYGHLILQKAGNISYNMMSIIKAVLQLLTTIGAAYIVDNIGRKPLLIISCIGSAIFMACEGIYFYLYDFGYNVDGIWWLPLFSMVMFNVSQAIGLSSISLTIMSEIFHPKVKNLGVCICKLYISTLVFAVGKLFQILSDSLGNCIPFFIFSFVGVLGVIFVIYIVPETKGKSLDDIQYYLKHTMYREDNKI